jgi:hypothetical protein
MLLRKGIVALCEKQKTDVFFYLSFIAKHYPLILRKAANQANCNVSTLAQDMKNLFQI